MLLLSYILDLFLPKREVARAIDAIIQEDFVAKMHIQRSRLSSEYTITTLLPYTDAEVKMCILEAKFHRNGRAIQLLGAVLQEYLCTLPEKSPIIIPLPLSRARKRARGHNQVESVVRKALMGERSDTTLLMRVRDTLPQTTLSGRERRANLHHAFQVQGSIDPHHTYIVVDDVVTTGSTLHEALRTLQAAGAIHIYGVALATSA